MRRKRAGQRETDERGIWCLFRRTKLRLRHGIFGTPLMRAGGFDHHVARQSAPIGLCSHVVCVPAYGVKFCPLNQQLIGKGLGFSSLKVTMREVIDCCYLSVLVVSYGKPWYVCMYVSCLYILCQRMYVCMCVCTYEQIIKTTKKQNTTLKAKLVVLLTSSLLCCAIWNTPSPKRMGSSSSPSFAVRKVKGPSREGHKSHNHTGRRHACWSTIMAQHPHIEAVSVLIIPRLA